MGFFSSNPQILVQETPNQNENSEPSFSHPIGPAAASTVLVPAVPAPSAPSTPSSSAPTAALLSQCPYPLEPQSQSQSPATSTSITLAQPQRSLLSPPPISPLSIPSVASTPPIPISTTTPNISCPPPRLRQSQHTPAPDAAEYNELSPSQLPSLLSLSQDSILIIDIRPYAQFRSSRLPNAISLNVPTILLKRSSTDWDKITANITDPAALQRFSRWRSTPTLLLLDTNTTVLAESNNLLHLLRRFRVAGYSGSLSWLRGGMAAIYKDACSIVQQGVIRSPDESSTSATTATPPLVLHGALPPSDLPIQTLQGTSTTVRGQSKSTPSCQTSFTTPNLFYDNIRQNVKLADAIEDKIPLLVSDHVFSRRDDLPFQWLRDLLLQVESPDHGAEMLALQFYRIQLSEQQRLQGIMNHHFSCQPDNTRPIDPPSTSTSTAPTQFPFSITAGIEMGTKNRYRNIWPFEHARVRLRTTSATDGSDYFNASYVQPMVTKRRYIATQGPLSTTFNDFWTIVWEQNASVIVMLTREVEGNHVKSDCYWKDGQYGHLQLKLDEQVGATDVASLSRNCGGFNFGSSVVMDAASDAIIKRVFTLHNLQQPNVPSRKIVHLQYLGWPDLNVPKSSRGILDLIRHVNNAVANGSPREEAGPSPIMLHCSAGIGRTGGFILADSILDGIRQALRQAVQCSPSGSKDLGDVGTSSEAMDLDEPEIPSVVQHRGAAPFMNTTSLHSGASDSIHIPSKPSTNGAGSSNKQQKPPHSLAEKLVNILAASNPPLSNAATVSAWSASLPSPNSEFANSGNGDRNGSGSVKGSVKGSESKPLSDLPSPPDFHGDENDTCLKVPRKLHQTGALPLLSALCKPIQDVLEDMREQRMSLCQNLKQYVFAHRVILEGALEIVDEEKEFLRQQRLEGVNEAKRTVQPWDMPQPQRDAHRHRESVSSSLLRSGSQPLNFWSSTSSFSSLHDDSGSSAAASSSAARPPDPCFTSPLTSSSALSRTMQAHCEASPLPSATNSLPVPVLTSPMRNLSIDRSSSTSSRHMAGRHSQECLRTPGSVAIVLPPPALTGKRSHSPSRWERKVGRERNVTGHEQDNSEPPAMDGQEHLAERPSVKRKLRSDDPVDARTGPHGKLGVGAGMTPLNQ